jgi:hypothetical protein
MSDSLLHRFESVGNTLNSVINAQHRIDYIDNNDVLLTGFLALSI